MRTEVKECRSSKLITLVSLKGLYVDVRLILALFAQAIVQVSPCYSDVMAPARLLRENCIKARTVIIGRVINSRPTQDQLTATVFKVERVLVGSVKSPTIEYFSFREQADRNSDELDQDLIVFLKRVSHKGSRVWVTATDISEFANQLVPWSFHCTKS